ncbi:MAG: glutamate--tRNA ligase [Candidatus Nanoarchaeia archaeon]|nr:glutamate--tRNA ligase [Candidatus Nanoarchaeia archaeon]MDD5588243.1 glutamate--tRNA ligase [Candidatus Nanoarchaeia archaeon]
MDLAIIRKYALENAVKHDGKCVPGAIIGKLINEDNSIKNKLKEINPDLMKIIKEVNKLSLEKQTSELQKLAPELLEKKPVEERKLKDLPDVKGKVVMRFAPFPSGPLHIGNSRTAILNDEYAKKYKGKLLLVIDDTIGSEEKQIEPDAYKLIPEGLAWLGIKFSETFYKSQRLEIYYKYADELIKKEKAYVCSCSSENIHKHRELQKACNCRSQTIKENLEKWNLMFDKKTKEGAYTLRIKTSMQDPNPAFRDRVIFRISERKHPLVKNKYKVWPLLDFSWAIDDYLLGITHIIRGKELMIETEMESYIWNIFNWPHSVTLYNGLFQIEGIKLSKSKSAKEVKSGEYIGWDDPRTWSIQSLKRRGFKPEAIRNFILSLGMNPTEIVVPVENLYSENRKLIEKEANRYFFIEKPVKIKLKKVPNMKYAEAPLHPDYPKKGNRKLKLDVKNSELELFISSTDKLEKNKNYRFMHLFNFKNNEFLSKDFDPKLNTKQIHWLPIKDIINVEIMMDNGETIKGIAEADIQKVKVNDILQFERNFFARLDKKEKNKLVFWYTHK